MARITSGKQRVSTPAAANLDVELTRVASLRIDELREEWRTCFGADPPSVLSRDLLARALSHRAQEKALGGIARGTSKELDRLANGNQATPRRIKIGSVLVREYENTLHEVYVVADGFSWRGDTYDSLSTIARKITGTKWNGPRFFGLRDDRTNQTEAGKTSSSEIATEGKSHKRPPTKSNSPNAFLGGAP